MPEARLEELTRDFVKAFSRFLDVYDEADAIWRALGEVIDKYAVKSAYVEKLEDGWCVIFKVGSVRHGFIVRVVE